MPQVTVIWTLPLYTPFYSHEHSLQSFTASHSSEWCQVQQMDETFKIIYISAFVYSYMH
jgi:hypothetical protein